jgi:hypothetical protein
VIVGGLWVNSLVIDNLGASVSAELRSCLHNPEIDWGSCNRKFKADWPAAVADHWYWAALYTLVPIPIVWLIVYGLVGLVRWIVAGFSQGLGDPPWAILPSLPVKGQIRP